MNRGIALLLVGAAIAATIAGFVISGQQGSSGPAMASDQAAPSNGGGLAASADKVDVSAAWTKDTADVPEDRITVTLNVADGWHVNANPASLDFLIPTEVSGRVDGDPVELAPAYPAGRQSDIELDDTRIRVYGDGTTIDVGLPDETSRRARASGRIDLTVRVQSCSDDGTCLAPSSLEATARTGH